MDFLNSNPPAPNPGAGQPAQTNALMMPQQPQQNMPNPSHQETVAAIRHFSTLIDELKSLAADPALGKSDIKGKVIDGASKLVAERMMSPENAVMELSNLPSDPRGQRQWVAQMMQQTMQARNNVLNHHVAASPATLDWGRESQHQPGSTDDHMATMNGLRGQYS